MATEQEKIAQEQVRKSQQEKADKIAAEQRQRAAKDAENAEKLRDANLKK